MTAIGSWLERHRDLPRRDCEVLLTRTLGIPRSELIAFPERPMADTALPALAQAVSRLRQGVPLAYVTGVREFYGLELHVDERVLIPRPDTELLVETTLELLKPGAGVLELGTGSGAVAVSLATCGELLVTATDSSDAALTVARRNAERHGANVGFCQGHWFAPVRGTFAAVVSNPPYVAVGDQHLAALRHEPAQALVSGADGLDAIREITTGAPAHLTSGGWLLLEHGFDQAERVRSLMSRAGLQDVETRRDLGGRERVTIGRAP